VYGEVVDGFQEFTVVVPWLSPVRLRRIKHFQQDRPIALRHSCQHVRLHDAGHAVIRTNADSGIHQVRMSGIPSTRPSLFYRHPVSDGWRGWLADRVRLVEQPAKRTGLTPPRLSLVSSEYRSVTAPLLRAVEDVRKHHPDRPVTVILPELVEGRWWGYLMHANRERRLRARLLRYGGSNVVISSVPWQLRPANPAEGIAEEEPSAAAASPQQHRKSLLT
jgi:hypothetical protein